MRKAKGGRQRVRGAFRSGHSASGVRDRYYLKRVVGCNALSKVETPRLQWVETARDSASANVAMALYPLSAWRAANAAMLKVYEALRRDGHQKNVVDLMQSRDDLYDYLGYHDYEAEHISVLWKGRIVESVPATELFDSDNRFVRQFLSGESQGPLGME